MNRPPSTVVQMERNRDGLLVTQCPHCPWKSQEYAFPRQVEHAFTKHLKKEHP